LEYKVTLSDGKPEETWTVTKEQYDLINEILHMGIEQGDK